MTDRKCGRCVRRWPTLPKQSLVELSQHACVEWAARAAGFVVTIGVGDFQFNLEPN
jgi:hypothetical protein